MAQPRGKVWQRVGWAGLLFLAASGERARAQETSATQVAPAEPTTPAAVAVVAGTAVAPTPDSQRLAELRREIARHDDLYFRKATPEISDYEYDRLKAEMRALEAQAEARAGAGADATKPFADAGGATTTTIATATTGGNGAPATDTRGASLGDDRTGSFATHRHRVPMLSLEKAYTDAEASTFVRRVEAKLGRDNVSFRVEPKYDGLAVSLTYEEGRLVRAVTRGNGVEGDDITANARRIRTLPGQLRADPTGRPWPERVELRGEIFMSLAEFARLNAEREAAGEAGFAHPRNVAVGTIRSQESQEAWGAGETPGRNLKVVCYGWGEWTPTAGRPATLGEFHERLEVWGLPTVVVARTATGEAGISAAVAAVRTAATEAAIPVDGVVIKAERVADQETLGLAPGAPRWALARKFAPEQAVTRLRAITLQVGRTGAVTPVAELEPVELAGSQVARATLHNADEIARRDLRVGDWVRVEKAGEIIPAIVGVEAERRTGTEVPYAFPANCPACAGPLTRAEREAGHRCDNRACAAQVARRLAHFASPGALDIAGLGPTVIEALMARGLARSPAELYQVTEDNWAALPGLGKRSAAKLGAALYASRATAQADGARLLYGLSLPGVGAGAARRLAEVSGGLAELADIELETLRRPAAAGGAGLGDQAATELHAYLARPDVRAEWKALRQAGIGASWARAKPPQSPESPTPSAPAATPLQSTNTAPSADAPPPVDAAPGAAAPGALRGQIVVITGTFTRWTRAELTKRLIAAGATVGADVTRRTTLLVVGTEPGAKLAQARERGVEILDEDTLVRRLTESGEH